jgi:hypothetical protein
MDTELRALKAMPLQSWEMPGAISKYEPTRLADLPRSGYNVATDPRRSSVADLLGNIAAVGKNILTTIIGEHPGQVDMGGLSKAISWPNTIPKGWMRYFDEYVDLGRQLESAYPAIKQASAYTPIRLLDELAGREGALARYIGSGRINPYGQVLLYGPRDKWALIHELAGHRLPDFNRQLYTIIDQLALASPKQVQLLSRFSKIPKEENWAYSISDMLEKQLGRKKTLDFGGFHTPQEWEPRLTSLLKTPMEWK